MINFRNKSRKQSIYDGTKLLRVLYSIELDWFLKSQNISLQAHEEATFKLHSHPMLPMPQNMCNKKH